MEVDNVDVAMSPLTGKADDLGAQIQNCEDEPIRVPGSIQQHGFLLLLDERRTHVTASSENAVEYLGLPLFLILGSAVDTMLPREVLGALHSLSDGRSASDRLTYLGSFAMSGGFFSVVTHTVGPELVMEFERQDRLVSPELTNQVITNFVSRLNKITDEEELCRSIAKQVKEITEFNRIMLYRFDEYGHGTVLCEENDGQLPSYLDLRFPAADIPQQARDLYILNTVRVIPNADYEPSPLRCSGSRRIETLDLSMSLLRSVSPIHLQYMRNMGTTASMSVSIVCDGRLWGLISGHHAEPKTIPYLVRSACDLLARLVSTQLLSLRAGVKLRETVHFHTLQRQVLTQVVGEKDHLRGMARHLDTLVKITGAEGAALVMDGVCETSGQTPEIADIKKLAVWLDGVAGTEVFQSCHLAKTVDWAESIRDVASGLIVARISDIRQGYLMWFRPEVVRTVKWAGQPKHSTNGISLDPRKSFEVWKELVRGHSKAWSEMEVESAAEFRAALMTIGLKRAEEAVKVGESRFVELTRALPNLVWTADDEGRLTYVNDMWLAQGFVEDGHWFHQERILPQDEERCRQLWAKSVIEGDPFECELHFLASAGSAERWNAVSAIPYLGANGRRVGWVGTCTDTTDRRQRELTSRTNDKLALTSRMTSVIAHEINNPLEAIGNILYLLAQRLGADSESRTYIELAESELLRISGITKQTLRWSRDSVQEAQAGTVGELFKNVLRFYAVQIKNRKVTVAISVGKDAVFFGRHGQLTQVLANLLSNAVQAVPIGGHVWLSAWNKGGTLEISVRDDGHGMSADTQRSLFQPFFSTKGDLGNGLGLYISREIIEGHGGRLMVTSELGVGTNFCCYLPMAGETATGSHIV